MNKPPDNPRKALLTTVKEAVDNSLDACEEAGILPEVIVEITPTGEDRFRVAIEDNGPGIVAEQIGKVFSMFQAGEKFERQRAEQAELQEKNRSIGVADTRSDRGHGHGQHDLSRRLAA